MKIGKNRCSKSKKVDWPCIYDMINYTKLSEDTVKNIYRCKRCLQLHTEKVKLENPICMISPTGNHKWNYSHNISFQQRWKHQEICDSESCEYCTSTREVSYVRPIGYNPHR